MTIPTDGRIDLDALAELQAWLLKRAQPNSGLRYERYGDGLARVEFYGGDATFVADHFHSKGAKTLADAIDLVRRAAIPSEQGEAVVELPMTPIEDGLPVRDELRGEQTILTYCNTVGTWDLAFFDSSEGEIEEGFRLGVTHWLDITRMWPGITTHPAPAAGVKAPFAVFGQEAIDAAMENERTAQQFRDDLVASPSPPALDGAGRDAVIEECAKVADGAAAQWLENSDTLPEGLGGWGPMCAEEIAEAIRALKETP